MPDERRARHAVPLWIVAWSGLRDRLDGVSGPLFAGLRQAGRNREG
jgi:hypothetical protein